MTIRVDLYCPFSTLWSIFIKITYSSIYFEFYNISSEFWSRENTDNTVWPILSIENFHQRLVLFSISNAFKKFNSRQHNFTQFVLNIMIFFNLRCIFQSFWNILIKGQYGLTHSILVLRIVSKKKFSVSNIHKTGLKDRTVCLLCPFTNLNKFLTNPPIFSRNLS